MKFKIVDKIDSTKDDVTKYIIEDDKFGKNEVSIIRKKDKIILCVPSQTNCKIGCTFCHLTGTSRPSKNLTQNWIASMVLFILEDEGLIKEDVYSNPLDLLISFMGVGEPLLNLDGLQGAMLHLNELLPGLRFGISTMMPSLKVMDTLTTSVMRYGFPVKLHLSVHGIFNRESVVKSKVTIQEAIGALRNYKVLTGMPIEYHYTLVRDVNDSVAELQELNSLICPPEGVQFNGVTLKFLKLSETNGCQTTLLTEDQIREVFPNLQVEFYDPPGRDVGSSCGMFDQSIYNEDLPNANSKTQD